MATIARKSDGRRIFTDAFKRRQVDRMVRGDVTVAALSRTLGIAPSLLHRWRRLAPDEDAVAAEAVGRSRPVNKLKAAQYIRELQLLVGKQTVELELLRVELARLKKRLRLRTGFTR